MEPVELRRAVAAARAGAAGFGLRVDDAVVLHDSDRVAVRLDPCDLLVRVAPGRQAEEAAFETEVARRLAGAGAPVGELDARAGAQVQVRDGFVLSYWRYYAPAGPGIAAAAYADALLRHHAALRRVDPAGLDVPHFGERAARALAVVEDLETSPELPASEREFLAGTLRGLTARLAAARTGEQLLHGEPHPGNVLDTAEGPLFVDLATCCRGPVEFDLAHAPDEVAAHYPGADPGVLQDCRALNWALFSAWRWRREDQMPDREHWRAEGLRRVRAASGGPGGEGRVPGVPQ
ncbi:aminoglycoside phosphotransferase family protein [Streptomyces indicus]|uniref:Ser/Thr protein kinase RdoA involved in Cpx stress response, MazF antagonist n=1 Tax=Streptomyces indicus TaxID=417292 RepID=A0A1G9GYS8_9ACTN|nr:aminoglycoside phosphotransferase family protein [Streptomyces indicus]SDL05880.1 Ser/Thr protein kinase RdoA involved in Cpx stress response, MazF antagonist [Streptomyces indicus]